MSKVEIAPWPVFAEDERNAVEKVLASGKANFWAGVECRLFEQEFATWCGVKHGISVFNGTVALEIALRASGIQCGDEVIVTPRSFLASAAAVAAIGAIPVFADVDLDSGNLTAETIEQVITEKTRGVVVVHLGGWPADMPAIMELANKHGIKVIEDCAQAHGAAIDGKLVGSFGHAAAFSFCQDKIMSTGGEGGMIITDDDSIHDIAWSLRDHGRDQEQTLSENHQSGFRWTQVRFGTNGRMTEMQAAIGRCQLQKVEGWLEERHANARALIEGLQNISGMTIPVVSDQASNAFYRLTVLFDEEQHRNEVVKRLRAMGIPAAVGPCPEIYREQAFVEAGYAPVASIPNAENLGKQSMVLPVHPGMQALVSTIIDQITTFFD
jgi:dTDP-4-amino-4,6-dideoxygalactose transaminase